MRIEIKGDDALITRIRVDGQEIRGVHAMELTQEAGACPVLKLELYVLGDIDVDLPAGVVIVEKEDPRAKKTEEPSPASPAVAGVPAEA